MTWPADVPNGLLHRVVDVNAALRLEEAGLPAIEAWQAYQWRLLQDWLMAHTPWWAERLKRHADWRTPEHWPILIRDELQTMVAVHGAAPVPPHHGGLRTGHTSGSSGTPVRYFASQFAQRLIDHLYFADHERQGRNPHALRAVIDGRIAPHEGAHITHESQPGDGTGRILARHVNQFTVREHLEWINEHRPRYLTTTPAWLGAMLDAIETQSSAAPRLEQVMTYTATVDPLLRSRARALMGASIRDRYSCDECGPLAFQCPLSVGHYHVAVQNVRLEVVDAQGAACVPGTPGRVLVTALHQYATPLVRYDIGDVAALHASCPGCGMGVAALSHLLGRRRFLIRLPSGSLTVPRVTAAGMMACAPLLEYRVVQHTATDISVEVVMARPITAEETRAVVALMQSVISPELDYSVVQVDRIPRTASVKPQDVISLID
jgi:phenylacetate-CoA ligase